MALGRNGETAGQRAAAFTAELPHLGHCGGVKQVGERKEEHADHSEPPEASAKSSGFAGNREAGSCPSFEGARHRCKFKSCGQAEIGRLDPHVDFAIDGGAVP